MIKKVLIILTLVTLAIFDRIIPEAIEMLKQ